MIITADRVIPGDGQEPLKGNGLLIEHGRITKIGPAEELMREYPHEEVQSYPGCSLLPGLIDLHTHIGYYYGENPEYEDNLMLRAYWIQKRMQKTLEAGVTTIRDVSSADNIGLTLKKACDMGFIQAPRIYTCLQGICMTGGHGYGMTGAVVEADGPLEIQKAVRQQIRDGADWIKVLTSEGYRGEEYSLEELEILVAEAHRLGRKVAAHAGYGPSLDMCIQAGCDSIEHGTHLTLEQAALMRDTGKTWVPTMYAFFYVKDMLEKGGCTEGTLKENSRYVFDAVEAYRSSFRNLYHSGVCVAAGTDTDCLNAPEASPVAKECACMTECGITPLEAITCASWNGAKTLGMGEELGLLKAGYLADILVTEGNPAEDITALEKVEAVYQGGKRSYQKQH